MENKKVKNIPNHQPDIHRIYMERERERERSLSHIFLLKGGNVHCHAELSKGTPGRKKGASSFSGSEEVPSSFSEAETEVFHGRYALMNHDLWLVHNYGKDAE